MIGIFFAAIGTLFDEAFDSLGKKEVNEQKESIYTMGFFSMFWGFIVFVIIAAIRNSFVFQVASLPILIPRILLDILQNHFLIIAAVTADRTTFGFVRSITIPLLLITDILLGYQIKGLQFLGIFVVLLSVIMLILKHGIDKKGIKIVLFTAINAVITITLYKYNITHYNSVEAEGIIAGLVIMIYFFVMAIRFGGQNPLAVMKRPIFFTQSFSEGFAQVFNSFAFYFAPASVITTAIRAFGIMWTIVSGRIYFHEKHLMMKCIVLLFLVAGLVLLAV